MLEEEHNLSVMQDREKAVRQLEVKILSYLNCFLFFLSKKNVIIF